jgi:hypothetical protein
MMIVLMMMMMIVLTLFVSYGYDLHTHTVLEIPITMMWIQIPQLQGIPPQHCSLPPYSDTDPVLSP